MEAAEARRSLHLSNATLLEITCHGSIMFMLYLRACQFYFEI